MIHTGYIGSFQAEDMFDRLYTVSIYTVYIYTNYLPASSSGTRNAKMEGRKSLRLEDGSPVCRLGKGKYEIAETRLGLTSTDPDAL